MFKNKILGLLLLSPIASGLKIAFENVGSKSNKYDIFCNDQKIKFIDIPILLIHGKNDKLIKYTDCQIMAKTAREIKEWYPDEGTHNNIIERYRKKYYDTTKAFINKKIYK